MADATTTVDRELPGADVDALLAQPHRRYNPLVDEWVLVSTERTRRPWQGRKESPPDAQVATYEPTCYLCPGNTRANGAVNPGYEGTFVFTNDFAALRPDTSGSLFERGLLKAEGEQGTCRVLCFSPRHDVSVGQLPPEDVRGVIDLWASQTTELGQRYRWVQVFENRGATMGASNPHPHGQIWAGTALPRDAAREDAGQERYLRGHGTLLLIDYAAQEAGGPRVVVENRDWLVVVPFWASWPFETLVVPKRAARRLPDLDDEQRDSLARVLIDLLGRYDNLFKLSFPYSMGWHQAPYHHEPTDHWQVHAHFYPPLLRSASVRKFMVGYELLAETQRDVSAEEAAERLRASSPIHYRVAKAAGAGVAPV